MGRKKDATRIVRWLYLVAACICIALGTLGLVIPGLPTTPFLLLATWLAARSAPRLQAWLLNHRWFGPPLRDWENEHAVSTKAKVLAVVLLVVSWLILTWTTRGLIVPIITGVLFTTVTIFLLTRPSPRRHERNL